MKILRDNKMFDIISDADIITELPMGSYEVQFGAFGRMSLKLVEDTVLPEKVYSNDNAFIEHVMHTWNTTEKGNIGVGLVGLKGLGKSFTANNISLSAGVPIIKIIGPAPNSQVFSFLNKIEQDFVLYLDEFEKNFDAKRDEGYASQEDLLTFLDNGGERKNKILFLITANNQYSISEFLKNRPSRLRYYKEYLRLDDAIIREVIDDLLDNKEYMDDLLRHLPYEDLNIDVLIQIIKEINMHNKPYSTFKSFFNYSKTRTSQYEVWVEEEGSAPVKLEEKLKDREEVYSGSNLGKYKGEIVSNEDSIYLDELEESYKGSYRKRPTEPGELYETIPVTIYFKEIEDRFKYLV